MAEISSSDIMEGVHHDFLHRVNEKRQNDGIVPCIGSRFLRQTAQSCANEEGSRYALAPDAVPANPLSPTERATNGQPHVNGALAAFKGGRVGEIIVCSCTRAEEAFNAALADKKARAIMLDPGRNALGAGANGALYVLQVGAWSGDRSGVLETEENVPVIEPTGLPLNLDLPLGSAPVVIVRE